MKSRAALLLMICLSLVFTACSRDDSLLLQAIIRLSPGRYADEAPSEEKIEQWQRDVRRFDAIVQEKIEAADQASSLHKMLAEEYSKLQMYGLSLEQYEEVLRYEPSNHIVLYSAGVSASQYALSRPDAAETDEYLQRAVRYHQRSIEIDPGYSDPYLALAILYHYELGETQEAKDLLHRAVELFPGESSRMLFVLAQIAVTEDRIDDAINFYDRISQVSRVPEERNAAISNREALLAGQ